MCTVSWSLGQQGCRLYFNRDERRSRPRAKPPSVINWKGVPMIAPVDPEGGGSWIALNCDGGIAFLLNNYAASFRMDDDRRFQSRGEIPLNLASCSNASQRLETIRSSASESYRPFFVGYLSREEGPSLHSWDGQSLEECATDAPLLTTSSYLSETIQAYRRTLFDSFRADGGDDGMWKRGIDFHRDRSCADAAFNPAMSRTDAETHCLSRITVTSDRLQFDYWERDRKGEDFDFVATTTFADQPS